MRRLMILVALSATLGGMAPAKHHPGPGVNLGFFYSSLSPYGEWIDCNLGYVWRPFHISYGWRPYLMGRWAWTSYGWYWISYEPFGWATFHYGRWHYDDYYGWIWIPDDTWGPAWVEWRYDDDYVGWAPLAPQAIFDVNIGVRFTNRWVAPHYYWNFVPYQRFTAERIVEYVQPIDRNPRIFGNTRGVVNIRTTDNRVVNSGVDVRVIERRGNIRVNTVEVVERSRGDGDHLLRDGGHERLEVYRPRLERGIRDNVLQPSEVRKAEKPIILDGERIQRSDRRESVRPGPTDRRESIVPPKRKDVRPQDELRREVTPPPAEQRYNRPQPKEDREAQRRDETRKIQRRNMEQSNREPSRTPERGLEHRSQDQHRENDRPAIERRDGRGRVQDRGHGESRTRDRRPR
ncbi:MAG: hypothetical protein HY033_04035 [Ignavibacteriae bacterium]|nr:hypothetical protein [Ignavibacteria bacterium]MBI3364057.1 hypothetical protein [Ignavibacteriota bacterium]